MTFSLLLSFIISPYASGSLILLLLYYCLLSSLAVPQAEEPELLEEVASIGRDDANKAAKIATAKEQGHAVGGVQELPKESEKTPGSTSGSGVLVEEKIPLRTMIPLSPFGT